MIKVYFKNCKSLKTNNNQSLQGFTLIDEKGYTLQPGKISIQKNCVSIDLPSDKIITEIRYAYSPYSTANLQNEAEVPASTCSFKID